MNPLLPFVRTPTNAMPFNSVDLSLSSGTTNPTNRNSLTPSPRNLVSPGTSSNRFSKSIAGDVDDSINNGANKAIDDTNKLGTDPIAFLSEMSEQLASMRSNRNMTTSSTLPPLPREQNNINSDLSNFRINGGNDKVSATSHDFFFWFSWNLFSFIFTNLLFFLLPLVIYFQSKQRSEPMELGRESNATNLFENESLSNSVHLQQLLGLTPPATSSITPNLNDLSKSLLSIFNSNTSTATTVNTSPMLISPKSHSNFLPRQTDTSKNYLNTSNDDSLDSQSGAICNGDDGTGKQQNTRYRRRKPQKTVRCSSNELNTSDNTMDNEKNNAIKNDCHKVDNNLSNGINFSSFHSETNSILPSVNSVATTLPPPSMSTSTSVTTAPPTLPQTQSMDLSHHCTNQEMFENGLGNYSKSNDLNLTNSTVASQRNDKDTSNLLQSDEMNGLNIFGSVNFGHMRGVNLTNDIATFPNTDDLVKKVEELVKCNEQNGFGDNDFSPMELTKSDNNKMVSDAYENNRLSNGICESIKTSTNIEHVNNHSNVVKCIGNGNDNGIVAGMMCDQIKNNTHESGHDEVDKSNVTTTTTTTTAVPTMSNPNQTCEMDTTKSMDSENISEARNSTGDGILEKLTDDINKQSNLIDTSVASAQQQNDIANNTLNNSAAKLNSDEAAKASMSASSSESPSNTSPTPKKRTVTKKKINNRCNGKMGGGSGSGSSSGKSNANKSNQKNAKSNDKSEKKSDSKKTKSKDDSTAADGLNKFRGPYVHVDRDGTVDVINAPLNEEIAEKQSKFKKSYISQRPADRNRVRGLHISTLSNKYDAVTIDISWMCVFCKLGPHKFGLGDLFGPFILSTESEDFQLAQIDPKQDVFKSHRSVPINAALLHNISAIAAKSMSKPGNASNVSVFLYYFFEFYYIY